jgi:hypothetical protein
MAIWIVEGSTDDEGLDTRALLLDSVTERPLHLPAFQDREQAETFLAFATGEGVSDVRRLEDGPLDDLHTRWARTQQVGA